MPMVEVVVLRIVMRLSREGHLAVVVVVQHLYYVSEAEVVARL
jgi:hypothetical protein